MSARTGFFSWWIGELNDLLSGRDTPSLALALSDTEIALIERGVDAPLGIVEVDAQDRMERVETLRAIAEKRVGRPPVVEVRLPPAQVMFQEESFADEEDRRDSLRDRLEAMTGRTEAELRYDVSPPTRGGPDVATVAVALRETVDDALGYARDWGFNAVRVSSIETPRAFPRGPDFIGGDSNLAGSSVPKIAAMLALVACTLFAVAGVRALSAREGLADETRIRAERAKAPEIDMESRELALGRFAHAAAMAIEQRASVTPVWRVAAEAAKALPPDASLTALRYEPGRLRLEGSAASIEALATSMERSALFTAPRFAETSAKEQGAARFVLDLSVEETGSR